MDSQEFQQWTDKLPPQERQVVRALVSTSVVKSFVISLSKELIARHIRDILQVENPTQYTPIMQIVQITRRALGVSLEAAGHAFSDFFRWNPNVGQQVLKQLDKYDRDLLKKFISE